MGIPTIKPSPTRQLSFSSAGRPLVLPVVNNMSTQREPGKFYTPNPEAEDAETVSKRYDREGEFLTDRRFYEETKPITGNVVFFREEQFTDGSGFENVDVSGEELVKGTKLIYPQDDLPISHYN